MSKLINYLKLSYIELTKVDWPSKKQTTKHTMMVISITILFTIFFTVMDKFLELGLKELILIIK